MSRQRIRVTDVRDRYKFLWVKEIRGVDLSQHCARTFQGSWRKELSLAHDRWRDKLSGPGGFQYELLLHPAWAFYICGVTDPYVWSRNAHLAFVPDDVGWEEHRNQGLTVETLGLRRVMFSAADVDDSHPQAWRREYATCRNWQFAHWLERRKPQQAALFGEDVPAGG